jgi:hypothetical protein
LGIDHGVVRLRVRPGQIVFGNNNLGGIAVRPRQGLEFKGPLRRGTQVYGAEIFCKFYVARTMLLMEGQHLRLFEGTGRPIISHAIDGTQPARLIVPAAYDWVSGVAQNAFK